MARLKLVLAMMMHETNTFSPVATPLSSFRPLQGEAAIAEFKDTNTQLGGFLHVAQQAGAEIVLPVAGGAHPSGYVEKAAYEDMAEAIVGAVRGGCDAVFLALHGAMVAEHVDDGEGELLRRIRAVAPRVPIAVGLDFHSHMTAAMVDNATLIAGYCTYPHVDMGETGQRAGRTMMRALRGEIEPVMVWGSLPMMTSTLVHTPARQPMKDVMDMAMAAEKSVAGQIAHARSLGDGPVVLVDHGDNTASGGTQDVMSVIEEVMRQGLADVVAGPICDPAGVRRLVEAGTAASVTLPLGGRIDMPQINLPGKPLSVTGKVTRITDGQFTVTGPMATGTRVRMGRTAVLDTGAMQIVVSEGRSEPFDTGVFTHCGIDPRRKKYVLIKSRQHFRAGFEPIARHIVLCDGDGVTSSDLRLFSYRNRRRPLFPFERDF
jgi:microcystin degradation protein MlrC